MELLDLNKLGKIEKARFISRLNRFVGICEINGKRSSLHIADTGRLKEILVEGREILVLKNREGLKTDYKLLAVKMENWILINTSLHSKIAKKVIEYGILGFKPKKVKAEVKFGNSRLDFLVDDKIYVEVKGSNLMVNLNNLNKCLFPDAPTERGRKHIRELMKAKEQGYGSVILIMGLRDCDCFSPNFEMDKEFGEIFIEALKKGVEYVGFKIKIDENFKVVLNGKMELCRELYYFSINK
ncbi:MAG: sugar fermentation stimulation protein [Methanothermococcus sp.]|jgi:sugar fermentation stimulation protein A|uniref:DNA/RNA nuclease SfsA n=1 Tax=Methanothermococcus TaxID=155862 RepID=UPI00036367F7|nr:MULTISPECIES: DNA/RNA nuclease SfsA [Methanothermococcus]MDK2790778.1 sugar fermentation stimulation protein [Methanothermococcus sp.]MDK2988131.1 sugar fermentation stimulation protein [Methanothermococcus sp.]